MINTRTKTWLRGMLGTAISWSSMCIPLTIVDPLTFNPLAGAAWGHLGVVAITFTLIGVGKYLRQYPLPSYVTLDGEVRRNVPSIPS